MKLSILFALVIALTFNNETFAQRGRVVNAAAVASYQQGQEAGLDIRKQWLASQDGKTRETHDELGNLPPIGVNEPWTLNSDEGFASALSPATFGLASEDCNCRCTVIPIVV